MPTEFHKCKPQEEVYADEHSHLMCGHGFREIHTAIESDGSKYWYASDDHNGTHIFYCPFCGVKL